MSINYFLCLCCIHPMFASPFLLSHIFYFQFLQNWSLEGAQSQHNQKSIGRIEAKKFVYMAMDPSILLFNIPISHSSSSSSFELKNCLQKTFFYFFNFSLFKDYLKSFHFISILMALHKIKMFKKFKEFFSLVNSRAYLQQRLLLLGKSIWWRKILLT